MTTVVGDRMQLWAGFNSQASVMENCMCHQYGVKAFSNALADGIEGVGLHPVKIRLNKDFY